MKDYKDDSVWLMLGDCLERMKEIPDGSVDSIVTDPPYGLGFMGKHWDKGVPSAEIWAEALRVLKPGGHLLAFAGTRTQHRMAVNIEDAGFEIRDMIAWIYGTGFPKSHNLKDEWAGWGTALKPALEPVTVARKPFKGTVAANVLEHGTGALNIDECRVATGDDLNGGTYSGGTYKTMFFQGLGRLQPDEFVQPSGRWPANLIHDGSDEVLGLFPDSAGCGGSVPQVKITGYGSGVVGTGQSEYLGGPRTKFNSGSGSAARFFYCAKASKKDRDEGLGAFAAATAGEMTGGRKEGSAGLNNTRAGAGRTGGGRNIHPTVKPTDLMRYLCRLVTPPNGIVLDPFLGSGSTGKAARLEGFRFIGIERDSQYFDIAKQRICLIH